MYGDKRTRDFKPMEVQGKILRAGVPPAAAECDVHEKRPAFVMSNDDIYNLGHYMNDVMGVWCMLLLANKDSRESVLVNMDGVRRRGPAGGDFHRTFKAPSLEYMLYCGLRLYLVLEVTNCRNLHREIQHMSELQLPEVEHVHTQKVVLPVHNLWVDL